MDDDEHNYYLGVGYNRYQEDENIELNPSLCSMEYYQRLINEIKADKNRRIQKNEQLYQFINVVLNSKYCYKIGFLVHEYIGDIKKEKFIISDFKLLNKADNLVEIFPDMEIDVLYWIE